MVKYLELSWIKQKKYVKIFALNVIFLKNCFLKIFTGAERFSSFKFQGKTSSLSYICRDSFQRIIILFFHVEIIENITEISMMS